MKFTNFGKKLFAFVAIALFGLALVACGGGNQGGGNEGGNDEQEQLKAQHQANVNAVLESIFFDETLLSEVKGNMTLVQTNGKYPEVKIEWTSSEADIIAADGTVVRPALDDPRAVDGKVEVTLTVSASQGEAKGTKTFKAYVLGEKKTNVATIQAAKASFYALMQEADMKYSDKTSEMAISAEFTGEVVIKISKGIFVNDGSGVVYVYGSSDAVVGDTVRVSGNLYAYYGLIELGSNVTVEKVADQEFAAPVFEETTVSEYTAALDAALDANGKIVDVDAFVPFSCGALKLYAKVEKGDKGSGDTYYLADPYTGQSVAIYHYTTADHTATLDALVGKYVYANVYAYDTHSALADRYRVVWDGSEMVEAEAPSGLTDAQKVEAALGGLAPESYVEADYELPTAEGVSWALKGTSANATLEEGVLKVTRPSYEAGHAAVVLVASCTIGVASSTKEFTVNVVSEKNPAVVEVSEFATDKTYKLGFYHGGNYDYLFINGEMTGYYGTAVANAKEAADVKVVAVEGGYQILVGNKYLELTQSGKYTNVGYVEASTGFVWTYNEEYNTFVHAFEDATYYVGTYGTNVTLGASKLSYAATSYVGHLYEVDLTAFEEEQQPEPTPTPSGDALVSYEINNAMPSGLTYISNNPTDYPNPSFYKNAGGLKMNFGNMGVQTATFEAQNSVVVTFTIAALNQNSKTGEAGDCFKVYGLDANGNVVAEAGLATVVKGENAATLTGEGIVSVKVVMVTWPHDGTKYCNVELTKVVVAKAE